MQLFSPKTKSRSISLLAALMNIPAFSLKDKTLMDQILGLERLRTEYMRSSGTDVVEHPGQVVAKGIADPYSAADDRALNVCPGQGTCPQL